MHSLQQTLILLVSLFTITALSVPTATRTLNKRSFSHHVRRTINRRDPAAGPNAMAAAYRKYGFTMPKNRQLLNSTLVGGGAGAGARAGNASAPAGGFPVAAVPEPNAAEYLSPVTIGGQTVTLDFDTGSSDLWVFSTALSARTIDQHTAFDPAKSRSFQLMQGATWQISYGDGSGAAGVVGKDQVTIGGATATGQAVELATAVSQAFVTDTNNDGLVGLAFSKLNTVKPQQQTTFFDTVMPQLAMPVFSVDLRNDNTGTYTFGAIDQSKFTGQLTNVPVDSSGGFWQVQSPAVQVGNQRIANTGGSPAIADTGTSLLLVDDAVANAYYSAVPGATLDPQVGGFTYPCNAAVPDFGVNIGPNYMAVVPGSGITFAQVDANTCFGGVQSNGGANLQIYGDVLFRAQYVVFDGGNKALQIAPKSNP